MAMMSERAFPKADTSYLKSAARAVGLEEIKVPRDIKEAQTLKDRGVPVPGNLDPEESYLLLEITKRIQEGASVPDGLVVYLNDRGVTNIPENDAPTVLFRQKRVAFNNLIGAVKEISDSLKK
jgi:hypothetical protein